jgi:hypothetical protein
LSKPPVKRVAQGENDGEYGSEDEEPYVEQPEEEEENYGDENDEDETYEDDSYEDQDYEGDTNNIDQKRAVTFRA